MKPKKFTGGESAEPKQAIASKSHFVILIRNKYCIKWYSRSHSKEKSDKDYLESRLIFLVEVFPFSWLNVCLLQPDFANKGILRMKIVSAVGLVGSESEL